MSLFPALAVEFISPAPPVFHHLFQWWSILHPRPQCSKLPRQWWSILHPCQHGRSSATPVVEYIASAPAVIQALHVVECIAPAPAVVQAPTPVVESIGFVACAFGGVFCTRAGTVFSPAPVEESVAPAPAVVLSPAPVVESIVAPAVEEFFFT